MATLYKGDHTVTTSVPAEAVQLRAKGYRDAPVVVETLTLESVVEEVPTVEPVTELATKRTRNKQNKETNKLTL